MSKKATNQPKPEEAKLENGTVILTGATREEVADHFDELKASAQDAHLMAGAVGRNSDGTFALRIDIVNQ
jgi:UDP-N-acetylglucosamine 2-epimerase